MKKIENTLILLPYNPEWKDEFDKLKSFFTESIGEYIIGVEHIGSTSIEGLIAKPIIDLDIVIDSYDVFPEIVSKLGELGFVHRGDLGIKDREAFKRKADDEFMNYHMYVCPKDSKAHLEHIKFRDYLRTNSNVTEAYALLKKKAIEDCEGNRETYTNLKSDFVNGVLKEPDCPELLIAGDRINIRRANIKDSDFIRSTERDSDNCSWVANWPLQWRISKFGDDDFLQTIIELKDGTPIGFIIFKDILSIREKLQLKRIALNSEYKRKGYGKEALYLAQKLAFDIFGTKMLYLSTIPKNIRAQNIYKATGFTPKTPDPCVDFYILKEDYYNKD